MNRPAEQLKAIRPLKASSDNSQLTVSAVSWGAIIAGAAVAAALSLILLLLGSGLGFSAVSPWAHSGVTAATFGISTILWLTVTQLIASGMGGYIAGRLRTKWVETHKDEIHFRDTAHGFLAWAVATLATAALLTSAVGMIITGSVHAGAAVTAGAVNAATSVATKTVAETGTDKDKSNSENGSMGYFVDALFRKDATTAAPVSRAVGDAGSSAPTTQGASTLEATRIFANAIQTGSLPPEDTRYIGQLIAQRTGLTQQEAEQRVTDIYARLQNKLHDAEIATGQAADQARKASVYAALWLFISLLIGAFFASLAATYGGRQRDLELAI